MFFVQQNFHQDQLDAEGLFTEYRVRVNHPKDLLQGQAQAIKSRGISKETCEKFGYLNAKDGNDWVQAATYYTDFGEPASKGPHT